MSDILVARRYAEAMIDVATEQDAVEQVGKDLAAFDALLKDHDGQLYSALCTPVFSGKERTDVLEALLPKLGMHALTSNFIQLVNAKSRLYAIGEIAKVYGDIADERAGRVTVRVTTAEAMSDAIAQEVRDAMTKATGKEVILQADVDATLIGGMIARVGGKVYDSSIRSRLRDIERALVANQGPAQA